MIDSLITELVERLSSSYVLLIILIILAGLVVILVWGMRQNREVSFCYGLIKLKATCTQQPPAGWVERRNALQNIQQSLTAVQGLLNSDIRELREREMRFIQGLSQPYIPLGQKDRLGQLLSQTRREIEQVRTQLERRLSNMQTQLAGLIDAPSGDSAGEA